MERPTHDPEVSLDVERLVFFSDAVIAIAITLLVISLDVPPNLRTDAELRDALATLAPSLFSFFLSFVVIAIWWRSHHRLLRVVDRTDSLLVLLNFVLLGAIVFMPFASRVLGTNGNYPTAVILYAVTNLVAALALVGMREVAHREGLLHPDVDPGEFRRRSLSTAATGGVFAASIPVALAEPGLAMWLWSLVFVLTLVREWRDRRLRRARTVGRPAGSSVSGGGPPSRGRGVRRG